MKTKLSLLVAALCCVSLLTLTGCAWGPSAKSGWQGFSPEGDYDLWGLDGTLSTPWGTQHLHADRLSKRNNPAGTNALPALPTPNEQALGSATTPSPK